MIRRRKIIMTRHTVRQRTLQLSRGALLLSTLALCGCGNTLSVQGTGNAILSGVGLSPVKSVYQVADGLAESSVELSREEEYFLGRAVAAKILARYPLEQDRALNEYVAKIGRVLAAHAETPETFGGYHFAVLATPEVNAMAAPGGFIFVTSGLLSIVPDEDGLAAVLAHEIAHVDRQHSLKALSEENMRETLAAAGELASSLNCSEVVGQASAIFGRAVDDILGTLLEKGYARDQELEADRLGIRYMGSAGYNPHRLIDVLKRMEAIDRNSTGWFNTHPSNPERREEALAVLHDSKIPSINAGELLRDSRFANTMGSRNVGTP